MAFEFDTSEYDGEDPFKGSGIPEPGTYHVGVIDAQEVENAIQLKFEVYSPGTEQGKTFQERIWYTGSDAGKTKACQRRVMGFATRLGMVTTEQISEAQAAGESVTIDFVADAVGRQAIVELQERTYTDRKSGQERKGIQIPWAGIWALGDPKVADIPVNVEMAAMVGYAPPDDAPPAPAPAATKPKPSTPANGKGPAAAAKPAAQRPAGAQTRKPAAADAYADI